MSRLSYLQEKIVSIEMAQCRINAWKAQGKKIVFTNGCFDILHKGHVTYLAKAADFGTKLVVAVNSDDSVKRLGKAPNRPINEELSRATIIASLAFVDLVVVFNEDTPLELVSVLNPDVLVKGADYNPNETDPKAKTYIVGSDFIKRNGGEVKVVDLEAGFSSTALIEKMKN